MQKIYSECPRCVEGMEKITITTNGDSEEQEITCRRCGGNNKISSLSLDDDLIDFLADMKNTIDDIKEKVFE